MVRMKNTAGKRGMSPLIPGKRMTRRRSRVISSELSFGVSLNFSMNSLCLATLYKISGLRMGPGGAQLKKLGYQLHWASNHASGSHLPIK